MTSQLTLKSKLIRNIGANAYGQGITVLIQLVSMPLYLHYWGSELYGAWLILSAIPAYLALSDIGFASVAANDMAMRVANGDQRGALEVYQSVWLFICVVSAAIGSVFVIIIYSIPVAEQFSITQISEAETYQLLIVLMLHVLVGLQAGVFSAAFRAAGRYAYGTILGNTVRLAEWIVSIASLSLGGGLLLIATLTLIIRFFGLLITWLVLLKQVTWLRLGAKAATIKHVQHLLKPAIAFMAFPLGLALSLQGMVLIIGITLGSSAVVVFSAYRTLTRLLVQGIAMLNQAVWPEISTAYGASHIFLIKQLHRKASCINFWIALATMVVMSIFGEWFVGQWTHHAFEQNYLLFGLMLAATFLNVIWQTSWVVLMATNNHQAITLAFVVLGASGLLISTLTIPILGINGVGIALLLVEIPMLIIAISSALKLLNDKWLNYLSHVFFKWWLKARSEKMTNLNKKKQNF